MTPSADPRARSAPIRRWLKETLPAHWAQRLGRIYRAGYPFWVKATGSRTEWVATPTGRFCLPRDAPQDMIVRAIRAGEVFEEEVVRLASRHLRPGSTILDVGANLGQMSVLFSRLVGETGRVYSFEANPFIFGLLQRNLAANGCGNARAVFGAVHWRSGLTMRFPEPRFWHHSAYGSYGIDPAGGSGQPVPSLAIDDLDVAGPVDFVKIDAQGSDLAAMRGARRLIARHRMPILFEYGPEFDRPFGVSFADYAAFIEEIGYAIAKRLGANILICPRPISADARRRV